MEQRGRASEQLICQREEQRRGHHPLHPQDREKALGEVRPAGADRERGGLCECDPAGCRWGTLERRLSQLGNETCVSETLLSAVSALVQICLEPLNL